MSNWSPFRRTDNPFHLKIFHGGKRLPVRYYERRSESVMISPSHPTKHRPQLDITRSGSESMSSKIMIPRRSRKEKRSTGSGPGRRSSSIHVTFLYFSG